MRYLVVLSLAALLGACSLQPVSHDDAAVNCTSGMGQNVPTCHKLKVGELPNKKTAANNF